MLCFIYLLNIQHYKICYFHKLIKFTKERFFSCKWISRGIKRYMNAFCLSFFKEFNQEIYLKKRFTTTNSDSPRLFPISFIFKSLRQKLICSFCLTALHIPSIRIVTELTSHMTSL